MVWDILGSGVPACECVGPWWVDRVVACAVDVDVDGYEIMHTDLW